MRPWSDSGSEVVAAAAIAPVRGLASALMTGDEQAVVAGAGVMGALGPGVDPRRRGRVVEARGDDAGEGHLAFEAFGDPHELRPRPPAVVRVDGQEVEHAGAPAARRPRGARARP